MRQRELNKKFFKALDGDYIEVERIIHQGYTEFLEARKKGFNISQYFGKYRYIYKSPKGKISLIKLTKNSLFGYDIWEILKPEPNRDTERFKTKKKAEKRIREILI